MRLRGSLPSVNDLRGTKQRVQAHAEAPEGIHTALFPVDDADGRAAFETSLAHGPDGIGRRSAGGDNVLDEDD